MDTELIMVILVLIVGFYMAWNIGANDVSNAMGTSVGSGALTLKKAIFIAAILEFCGAFFLGSKVSQTMETGLETPLSLKATPPFSWLECSQRSSLPLFGFRLLLSLAGLFPQHMLSWGLS